jgi:hypothetical protein
LAVVPVAALPEAHILTVDGVAVVAVAELQAEQHLNTLLVVTEAVIMLVVAAAPVE